MSPCQIKLGSPLGRLRKTKPVQITVPLLKTSQPNSLLFAQRIHGTTTEAAHNDLAQPREDTATYLPVTYQIGHIAALWIIDPEIVVGHTHDHPTNLKGMNHADQIHTPTGQEEGYTPRITWR